MLKPYWVKLSPRVVEKMRAEARRLAFEEATDYSWADVLRAALEKGLAEMNTPATGTTGGVARQKS
jgi:hypothetical protein